MKTYVPPCWTFEEIKRQWENAQTADLKSKLKVMRTLIYAIDHTRDALTLESALFYRDILKEALPFDEWGNARRALAKLMPQYLKLVGCESVKIINEIQFRQYGEGKFIIGDPAVTGEDVQWYGIVGVEMLNRINRGDVFSFDTEDGIVSDARIRFVDAKEPIMRDTEYKRLESAAPIVTIRIESGRVALLDECGEGIKADMRVAPGHYKMCAYQLGKRSNGKDTFLIVLCATAEEVANDLKSFPRLCDS